MPSIRRLRSSSARFSHSEVKKLEELFHTSKADVLDAEFHKNLTDEFNGARGRQCSELKVEGFGRSGARGRQCNELKLEGFGRSGARGRQCNELKVEDTRKWFLSKHKQQESPARFSQSDVRKLEKLLPEIRDELYNEEFHQKLADEFNHCRDRRSKILKGEDVRKWFSSKKDSKGVDMVGNNAPFGSMELVVVPDGSTPESSSETPKGGKIPQAIEWEFEARSSNGAWYDVAAFVSYRFNSNHKLEALVRYEGFGADEDEWLIVKDDIRVRSVSLESSECTKVAIGDHVVCFRETDNRCAAHYDSRVIEIQRKLHDIRGCRCQFLIRYNNDQLEETVPLRRLCARPPPDIKLFIEAVSYFL